MTSRRVLIVDRDAARANDLCTLLQAGGYLPKSAGSLKPAEVLVSDSERPHVIVLDSFLPEMQSFDLVREIRSHSEVPIIVTGTDCVDSRIAGLEAGADDCLTKPFEARELIARMTRILHRSQARIQGTTDTELKYGALTINPTRRKVQVDSNEVALTATEFDLLCLFVANPNKPLSRELILEQLRGVEWESVDRSIDILVSRLRDKLGDKARRPRFIQTVRGTGYLFLLSK